MKKCIYVFGITERVEETLDFGSTSMGGEEAKVFSINYRDLSALVAEVLAIGYDPVAQNVLEHQRVIEEIMRQTTVIPMAFGTTFKEIEDAQMLLEKTYEDLRSVLLAIEGAIELGVKVFWDQDKMIKKLAAEKPEILEKANSYHDKMERGRLIQENLHTIKEEYYNQIYGSLVRKALNVKVNRTIGEEMIFNAAFLVEKKKEDDFDGAMNCLGQQYEELDFKYTGPWPPYNFVNITLEIR